MHVRHGTARLYVPLKHAFIVPTSPLKCWVMMNEMMTNQGCIKITEG